MVIKFSEKFSTGSDLVIGGARRFIAGATIQKGDFLRQYGRVKRKVVPINNPTALTDIVNAALSAITSDTNITGFSSYVLTGPGHNLNHADILDTGDVMYAFNSSSSTAIKFTLVSKDQTILTANSGITTGFVTGGSATASVLALTGGKALVVVGGTGAAIVGPGLTTPAPLALASLTGYTTPNIDPQWIHLGSDFIFGFIRTGVGPSAVFRIKADGTGLVINASDFDMTAANAQTPFVYQLPNGKVFVVTFKTFTRQLPVFHLLNTDMTYAYRDLTASLPNYSATSHSYLMMEKGSYHEPELRRKSGSFVIHPNGTHALMALSERNASDNLNTKAFLYDIDMTTGAMTEITQISDPGSLGIGSNDRCGCSVVIISATEYIFIWRVTTATYTSSFEAQIRRFSDNGIVRTISFGSALKIVANNVDGSFRFQYDPDTQLLHQIVNGSYAIASAIRYGLRVYTMSLVDESIIATDLSTATAATVGIPPMLQRTLANKWSVLYTQTTGASGTLTGAHRYTFEVSPMASPIGIATQDAAIDTEVMVQTEGVANLPNTFSLTGTFAWTPTLGMGGTPMESYIGDYGVKRVSLKGYKAG